MRTFVIILLIGCFGFAANAQNVFPGNEPPKPAFPGQTRAPIADQS
jgi:hypothetical protein